MFSFMQIAGGRIEHNKSIKDNKTPKLSFLLHFYNGCIIQ